MASPTITQTIQRGIVDFLPSPAEPKAREPDDFSDARPNPYAKRIRKQVTLRLDRQTLEYFKTLATETGVPYHAPFDLYLRDCVAKGNRLSLRCKQVA